jgi:Tetratricopeptide repeat
MFSLSRRTINSAISISVFSLVAPAIMFVLSVSIARAQGGGTDLSGTGGKHTIQGRIYFPSGRRVDSTIQVKLQSLVYPEITVFADMNGSFTFRSLSPASYTVVVDGGTDYEVARESVYIDGDLSSSRTGVMLPSVPRRYSVLVYLQPKVKSASSKPGVVNAALANVPVAARNLYQKGVESARAGDAKQAVEHLKGAIALYPDFPLALNELGLQYLNLKQSVKAVEALRAAVKLSPDAFTPRLNYGIALLEAKEFAEAES